MSTQINQGLLNNSPEPTISRYGVFSNGVFRPYNNIGEANSLIPNAYRHKGLTVLVLGINNVPTECWYRDGLADNNLVPKLQDDFVRNQLAGIQPAGFRINGSTNGLMSFDGKVLRSEDAAVNTRIGERAGENVVGGSNFMWGYLSGLALNGNWNIGMGTASLHTTVGSDNIALGRYAMLTCDGSKNIAIGALSATDTHSEEGTFLGFNTSAGEPVINTSIPNTSFLINTPVISSISSLLTAAGIVEGQRVAVRLKDSNIQIGGQGLTAGGASVKGIVKNGNIEIQQQGVFTSQGTGNTTLMVIANTVNVTSVGRSAHCDRSNQVALGDAYVTQLKAGQYFRVNLSIAPQNGQTLKWDSANGEFRPSF